MDYREILKAKIITMITNDLTIGRSDNDLIPFTNDEINKFVKNNNDNIEKVIEIIIDAYTKDGELELLNDPLFDWISEYLYDFIDTNIVV